MYESPWAGHDWLNPPAAWSVDGTRLTVTSKQGSDFWRKTHEPIVKDDGHLFGRVVEGDFRARVRFGGGLSEQYDQAGLMLRLSELEWLKCGVELDGAAYASVVATNDFSDWSLTRLAELPEQVELELVRAGNAVQVSCLEPIHQLLRVAPLRPGEPLLVGPMCASPKGPGFEVVFEDFLLEAL
jgi:hypothetical protein